ncbi:hypothetical protein [[Actinomadura] parvosata]|uniref:hypothetical protein n=1 Tax=[Actinomadura] parvosata TaxID=1955412 RepID=UPI0012BC731F|nr:hypothetical protein [Nonomuraea sp. ATCC 55076]
MRSEEELARAIRTIGERAEPVDLLAGVADRRRRRRGRRARGVLAAVCAVVLGWVAVVLWPSPTAPVISTPEPVIGTPEPVIRTPEPVTAVERRWPQAVFTMPERYRPLAAIDATRVLVLAAPATIEVYDSATGRASLVATLSEPPGRVAADGEWVAWVGEREVGFVPLRGGAKPVRQGPVEGEFVDRIQVVGDQVVWSAPVGGVWRLDLPAGMIEQIAGSDGLQLVSWPWAIDEPLDLRGNPTRLVNLATGRTVPIKAARGVEGLRCGPTWCSGVRDGDAVLQRTDGSRLRVRRGLSEQVGSAPFRDRFFVGLGVYDAQADELVPIEPPDGEWSEAPGVISWKARDGGVRVLNLAAVPPAR